MRTINGRAVLWIIAVVCGSIAVVGFIGYPDGGAEGQSAALSLRSPRAGTVFGAPATVPLGVDVAANSDVVSVEFSVDGQVVGTTTARPHVYMWTGTAPGEHTVTAVARTSGGDSTTLGPNSFTMREAARQTLLQPSSLVYEGAFRFPSGAVGTSRFGYGGAGMTFSPERNSLFLGGHEQQRQVAEVAVPEIRRAESYDSHDRATVLQSFFDPTDGKRPAVARGDTSGVIIGGLLPYNGKLYVSTFINYDSSNAQRQSHFVSDLDLSRQGDALGPFTVQARMTGYVSGYMTTIPQAWRAQLGGPALTGNCCLNVIGRTSYGPAVFAFDPATVGVRDPAPSVPLLYYTAERPLAEFSSRNEFLNGTTRIPGIVFAEGTRSLLFIGSHGLGEFCYGTGAKCKDPEYPENGMHAAPYVYRVWAYDVRDLAAVRARKKDPWETKPYAMWNLDLPLKAGEIGIRGVAYDPGTGRIFIFQRRGEEPLVHVFRVEVP